MSQTTSGRPPETMVIPPVRFIGEQDGPSEQQLKQAVAGLLRREAKVKKAYLCRVIYDDDSSGVVLGLDAENSEDLVDRIGAIFASIFPANMHLDVIFLSDKRHAEIRKVCPAFYARSRWRWW